jgi:hypothetical protein
LILFSLGSPLSSSVLTFSSNFGQLCSIPFLFCFGFFQTLLSLSFALLDPLKFGFGCGCGRRFLWSEFLSASASKAADKRPKAANRRRGRAGGCTEEGEPLQESAVVRNRKRQGQLHRKEAAWERGG